MLLAVQGWGQLANLGVLMVGLLALNSKGSGPYSHKPTVCSRVLALGTTNALCCVGVGSAGQSGGADGGSAGLQQQGQWAVFSTAMSLLYAPGSKV